MARGELGIAFSAGEFLVRTDKGAPLLLPRRPARGEVAVPAVDDAVVLPLSCPLACPPPLRRPAPAAADAPGVVESDPY